MLIFIDDTDINEYEREVFKNKSEMAFSCSVALRHSPFYVLAMLGGITIFNFCNLSAAPVH